MKRKFLLKDKEESKWFAQEIAKQIEFGDILALYGNLGAGKTYFSQYLAEELGVTEPVSSPSYVLLNEYSARDFPIFHFDLYRLNDQEEVFEIGLPDIFEDGVTLVEWPEILAQLLPENSIKLYFDYYDESRTVTVEASSEKINFAKFNQLEEI